jgi:alpha/beta superfamily hydrolase
MTLSTDMTASRFAVPGPVGPLEAALEKPRGGLVAAAVICHPHPLHQGTMDNKVVTTLARAFARLGAAALRFNFRGVGASPGVYDHGIGEREDAVAAVEWCRAQFPGVPLYLGGFSFGGATALAIARRVAPDGLVAVAPAVGRLPEDFAAPECPWMLIQGGADDVVPATEVLGWAKVQSPPPHVVELPGVGHFFHGQLTALTEAVTGFFGPLVSRSV